MIRYVLIIPLLVLMVLFLYHAGTRWQGEVSETLVEVKIEDLGVDPTNGSPVIILTDVEEGNVLPVFIGINEASSISSALDEEIMPRPMTHDLVVNILGGLGAELERVVIKDLKENIFYADLVIIVRKNEISVDCRPSDAIAVAVRLDAPIYVAREVLERSVSKELTEWWHGEDTGEKMGFGLQELTEEIARAMGNESLEGVLVSSVAPGGIAAEAGIQRGDVLMAVDDETVTSPDELTSILSRRSGKKIEVTVFRRDQELELTLTVPFYMEGRVDHR